MTETIKSPVFRLVVTVLAVIGAIAVIGVVGIAQAPHSKEQP